MRENLTDLSFQELTIAHKHYKQLRDDLPYTVYDTEKHLEMQDKLQFDYFDRRVRALEDAIDDKFRYYVEKV